MGTVLIISLRYVSREEAMMMDRISAKAADALASLVVERRPDWDRPGVIAALRTHYARGDVDQLTDAALRAARDPAAKTPAAIGFDQYWPPPVDSHGRPRMCPDHPDYPAHNCGGCRFEHLRPSPPPPRTETYPRPDFTRTPRPASARSGAQSLEDS